jgi:hypothetical protein
MWISVIASKDQGTTEIKRIQAAAERKTTNLLCALSTNGGGGGVYYNTWRDLTAPYTPQQNGVVERRNQTVMSTARCMLKAKGLPGMLSREVVNCAVYLLNRTLSKSNGDRSPYELWTGSRLAVSHLECLVALPMSRSLIQVWRNLMTDAFQWFLLAMILVLLLTGATI